MNQILPSNATQVELALDQSGDMLRRLGVEIQKARGFKFREAAAGAVSPLREFISAEFGFGEITDDWFDPMSSFYEAVRWQRLRGTASAVGIALGWLGYSGAIETAVPFRRKWNRFQISLGRVRDDETPDLGRIDRYAGLSVPARSRFVRGFKGYDVRAALASVSRIGKALVGDDSGTRIGGVSARWSFGRAYDSDQTLAQAELQTLGVWVPPGAGPIIWRDVNLPWSDMAVRWDAPADAIRKPLMASVLAKRGAWAVFKRADGSVIGCRRCRASHRVHADVSGPYEVDGTRYRAGDGDHLYLEAMTDFGDGDEEVADVVGFLVGAEPRDGSGKRWLPIADLRVRIGSTVIENAGGVPLVGTRPVAIEFGKTVRERVRALLRMT